MSVPHLTELAAAFNAGKPTGIISVCSAHPLVLEAGIRYAKDTNTPILIEATCNQVNQMGGYTGLSPRQFADDVDALSKRVDCPPELIILGGDHLGPNPWRALPANQAMRQASDMIDAYVAAGFRKIHLDTSMGCAGEPIAMDDDTTAIRAAELAHRAELAAAKANLPPPVYVIGTEVPPPGGAAHPLDTVAPTSPAAVQRTIDVHRRAFSDAGLIDAFARVIALVVQPGVEFGNTNVVAYSSSGARGLTATLATQPNLIFEAHSTDYQDGVALAQLVQDGFAILKVGPQLTFAMRQTLYALDLIASDMLPDYGDRPLFRTMTRLMTANPDHWKHHYDCTRFEVHMMQHYSLSDRIRYFWNEPAAVEAVSKLFAALSDVSIPLPLLWQHLPNDTHVAHTPFNPEGFVMRRIQGVLSIYRAAATQEN